METMVQTRCGRVRGATAANGVCAFLGISYAAPPVGANRLRPAQPVEPWTGIRDATVIGPEPPQPQFDRTISGLLFDPAVMGDDCLNLNIWTPDPGRWGCRSWSSAPAAPSGSTPAAATTAAASPATGWCS